MFELEMEIALRKFSIFIIPFKILLLDSRGV